MPYFKQSQYEIITDVINRIAIDIMQAKLMDENATHPKARTWQISHQVMESLVDELCIEFAKDNHRFNEDLFRNQCGNLISKVPSRG